MKSLLIPILFCGSLWAQNLAVVIHDPTGATADTPLSSSYQFAATPVGSAAQIVLRFSDTSANPIQMASIYVGPSSGSADVNPNFSITGQNVGKVLAANGGNFEEITLSFTPLATGSAVGYLQATYQIQQNGCNFSSADPSTQCTSATESISTLGGLGATAQFVLTYTGTDSVVVTPQPNSSTPILFGNVSTSSSSTLTFNLTNNSPSTLVTPVVALENQVYGSSAFKLDASELPATIAARASASFTITFAPAQTQQANATLTVGTLSFPISGTGIVVADIDALQISYVDSTGVRTSPQAATPISFGQVVAGGSTPAALTFTVANPTTSFNPVTVPALTATGVGFALAQNPSTPLSISPGSSITFQVVFSPSTTGTFTGTLAIGTRQFSLTGLSVTSAVPQPSFQLSQSTLASQQQVTLTIQLAAASTVTAIGQLTMAFTPSVTNVSDDPAVVFLATNGRSLSVNVAVNGQTATYSGNSAIAFQTGTTAGTLTFTLTFPNGAPLTKSFTIAPQQIKISTATAVRSEPNLVVTMAGFDNTYSAGKLSFTFFDTGGKQLTPSAIVYDATSAFHNYFFTNDKSGGAFAVQATFPVTGGTTEVGSVTATMTNSLGTTTTTQNF